MVRKNNITKIYEALFNRSEKIVEKSDINKIIKEFNKGFKENVDSNSTVKYLARHKYIKRIFLSFYYVNSIEERRRGYCKFENRELLFLVLNKINMKWYLGLSSGLYESGRVWQTPVIFSIINNKFSGKKKILDLNVKFYKVKDSLIFAIKTEQTKNKVKYFYSEPSKTYLDMVYLRINNKLIKDENTKNYLKKFPKWVEKKSK
jgi:hypothetical protein